MVENTTTAVDTFQRLLEKVRSKQLPLISLRPKEISENAAYEGDYDLFLPPEYMNELFEIVFDLAVEGGALLRSTATNTAKRLSSFITVPTTARFSSRYGIC